MRLSKCQHKESLLVAAVLLFFVVVYVVLSIVNHVCFRTSCLDLGVYTNALYDYAQFHANDSSIFLPERQNLLCDHFDLYLILFSPLVWLFGQWTLLVVQIVAVFIGGVGVFRLMCSYNAKLLISLLAMSCFMISFGVWHALSFDYHSNVVAACCLPWLLLTIRQHRLVWASLLVAFMLVAKETMPIWIVFILLALAFDYRHNRVVLWWIVGAIVFALIYFVVVGRWIMPSFGGRSPGWSRYAYMGENAGQMVVYMITHPVAVLLNFCSSSINGATAHSLKLELTLCLLLSGGVLLLLKPNYLLMLVPPLLQKFLAADVALWGISYHYNVELCTVAVIGAFVVIAGWRVRKRAAIVAVCVAISVLLCTFYTTRHPKTWIWRERTDILCPRHYYQSSFNVSDANRLLALIPANASVCATTHLVPHLALRDNIYLWPDCQGYDYDYLFISLDTPEAESFASEVCQDPEWQIVASAKGLLLATRTLPTP